MDFSGISDWLGQNPPKDYSQENPLELIDKVTGRPLRNAAGAALDGENPLPALFSRSNTTGEQVANKFLARSEEAGMPLRAPGQDNFPLAPALGMAANVGLDASNLAFPGLAKLVGGGADVAKAAEEIPAALDKLPTVSQHADFATTNVSDKLSDLRGHGTEYLLDPDGYVRAKFFNGNFAGDLPQGNSNPTVMPTAQDAVKDLLGLPKVDHGNASVRDAAQKYLAERERTYNPYEKVDVDPDRGARIAQAFEQMKHDPSNPEVQRAYAALIKETEDQYNQMLQSGIKLDKITPGMDNPYSSGSKALHDDIRDNNHMWYYPTDQGFGSGAINDHPLLQPASVTINGETVPANDVFRIVHDYFGHAKEGVGFGPKGEENAYQVHRQMFSPEAAQALATETRGQNSWVNFGPHGEADRANPATTQYAEQKAGLLPDWATKEGVPGITYDGDTLMANKARELTGRGREILMGKDGKPVAELQDGNIVDPLQNLKKLLSR